MKDAVFEMITRFFNGVLLFFCFSFEVFTSGFLSHIQQIPFCDVHFVAENS